MIATARATVRILLSPVPTYWRPGRLQPVGRWLRCLRRSARNAFTTTLIWHYIRSMLPLSGTELLSCCGHARARAKVCLAFPNRTPRTRCLWRPSASRGRNFTFQHPASPSVPQIAA